MPLLRPLQLKTLLLCGVLLVGSGIAHAQKAAAGGHGQEGPPLPLLWKVSDRDNAIYLLGSFHMLKSSDFPLSPDVDAAFADSESLVFELPPEEMGSPSLALQMAQAAKRTDGTALDSELPAATAKKLRAWVEANAEPLQKMQVSGPALQTFEPWFVALLVTLAETTKAGLDPQLGLDKHLAQRANQAGIPGTGLETAIEQIALLDGMGRAEQLHYLKDALQLAGEGAAEINRLHAMWRNADAEAIWVETGVQMRDRSPRLYRRINVARNDAWLPKLVERLQAPGADNTLVVVGALHLLGEDGVVEKLRAEGYEVERICSACNAVIRGNPKLQGEE